MVIINFASGNFIKGQQRLKKTLEEHYKGDFMGFTNEVEIGAPPHQLNPYAFKLYAFDKALEAGHTKILLIDASVWAIRDPLPVFEHISEHGYIMQEAGHYCGNWANDNCLSYFNITRDEANKMLMYGNAGFLGLDFSTEIAKTFFMRWKASMLAGIFKGSWDNHRHDMVCGSIIANQLNMEYQGAHDWLNYGTEPKSDKVYFLAKGL